MIEILIIRSDPSLSLPAYAKPGDAGADLCSSEDLVIAPGDRALVSTGLSIALPDGFAAFVHPRSGLAIKSGIGIVNAPGTIDSGYRGEIKVIVINHDRTESFAIKRGDRIAQLVIQRVENAQFVEVEILPESARSAGGFGSTGVAHE
ncbi:MAG: dUTP diphosphatase [Actinobacteria bacterium]|nr:dUTP diphosphatase [Actinomycetota bacterium]